MLQRQMSARYTAAAALLGRDVRDPLYFRNGDTEAAGLADRIELRTTADDEIVLTVEYDGGQEGIRGRRTSILFPTAQETAELFLTRAGTVLGTDSATAARAAIEALPGLADVRQLTSTLRPRTERQRAEAG
jgi:hypothetical protein